MGMVQLVSRSRQLLLPPFFQADIIGRPGRQLEMEALGRP